MYAYLQLSKEFDAHPLTSRDKLMISSFISNTNIFTIISRRVSWIPYITNTRQLKDKQFKDRQFKDRQIKDKQFKFQRQTIQRQTSKDRQFIDRQFKDRQFKDRPFKDR